MNVGVFVFVIKSSLKSLFLSFWKPKTPFSNCIKRVSRVYFKSHKQHSIQILYNCANVCCATQIHYSHICTHTRSFERITTRKLVHLNQQTERQNDNIFNTQPNHLLLVFFFIIIASVTFTNAVTADH